MAQENEQKYAGGILPEQMERFWRKVCEGSINEAIFQAFLKNVSSFTTPRGIYYNLSESQRRAAQIMGHNFIGINLVTSALQWKGIPIRLTEEELHRYSNIPASEDILVEVINGKWRGKKAVLWWAPPERYGLNLKELFKLFGTDIRHQPCFHKDNWWVDMDFAVEPVSEGWHLSLIEIPSETKSRSLPEQIRLRQEYEVLCKPVELAFLSLINYMINGEYIFSYFYTRTDSELGSGYTASVGMFGVDGLRINRTSPNLSTQDTAIGLLFSRKFSDSPLKPEAH
ncbi:MAG: hypothetical protein ACMUIA_10040 [bacterium]